MTTSASTYLMTFAETRDRDTEEVTQSIGFNISFRTLGDFGSTIEQPSSRPLTPVTAATSFRRIAAGMDTAYSKPRTKPRTGIE